MCFFLCSPRKYFSRSSVISPGGLVPVIFCPALYRREEQRHFPFSCRHFRHQEKSGYLKNLNIYNVPLFVYNWMERDIYGIIVFPFTRLTLWRHIFLARVSNMVAQHCMSIYWLHHCEDDQIQLQTSPALFQAMTSQYSCNIAILWDNAIASLRAVNTHGFPIKTQPAVGQAQNIFNLCNLGWDKGGVKSEVQKILFWIPGDCQNWRGPPQSTARKNAVKTSLGKKEEKLDFRTTVLISGGQRKLWQVNILELY